MTYQYYKNIFKGTPMPFAFVDMDVLDENIIQILKRAGSKPVRIATKSIRSTYLLEYILKSNARFRGLMCYRADEAVALCQKGFDDILMAYPIVHLQDIRNIAVEVKRGKKIVMMTDLPEHVDRIQRVAKELDVELPVCVDLNMSTRLYGKYFGIYRSSISNTGQLLSYIEKIKESSHVKLLAATGYEAQIAGMPDNLPGSWLRNILTAHLKRKSFKAILTRRKEMLNYINEQGVYLEYINGGSTGSLEYSIQDDNLTELAVGSGFYSPYLFDYYNDFRHLPAAWCAFELRHHPEKSIYTGEGEGYVSSGEVGKAKNPLPFLPEGIKVLKSEILGESQISFRYSGEVNLGIGDPIFMRYAKAGELCDFFSHLYLIRNGKIQKQVAISS